MLYGSRENYPSIPTIRRESLLMPTPIPQRASRTQPPIPDDDFEEEDSYYPQRMPSSAIRYQDTQGNQVIQRGRQRIVIHDQPPPKRRTHWLLILGTGMVLMFLLYLGVNWVSNWWTAHQLDASYGFPRTYQTDAIV